MTYRSEAERLRVILSTFQYAHPAMSMDEAVPMIFEIEKKAAKIEAPSDPYPVAVTLKDTSRRTVGYFIYTQQDIIDHIVAGKTIDAIKAVRARTHLGLKESKEGVEYYRDRIMPTL